MVDELTQFVLRDFWMRIDDSVRVHLSVLVRDAVTIFIFVCTTCTL
jgi:hypothetical protein